MRLINNRWGSDRSTAAASTEACLHQHRQDDRLDLQPPGLRRENHGNPDFPEVEFGVAPFGKTSSLLTSPAYSSTTLLPIQISSLNSASVTLDNFSTTFTRHDRLLGRQLRVLDQQEDPTTNADGGVYAEIIIFLGWSLAGPDPPHADQPAGPARSPDGTVPNTTFTLCHQSDTWASGQWRFFNFPRNGAATNNSHGKVDIKAILELRHEQLRQQPAPAAWHGSFSTSMYLTRIEVGTEIDDNTAGSAKINNLTFEINGTSKSVTLGH